MLKIPWRSALIATKRPMRTTLPGFSAHLSALHAQLVHTNQLFSSHPQLRQNVQCAQLNGVFRELTKAHFHIPNLTLDRSKRMLNRGPRLGFAKFDLALGLVEQTALTQPGIGAASRGDLSNHASQRRRIPLLHTLHLHRHVATLQSE
jgi:hypothetical protein